MTERRNADNNPGVPGQIGWLDDAATSPASKIGTPEEAALSSEGGYPMEGTPLPASAPWSIPKSVLPSSRRPLRVTIGLFLLAVVLIIGLIFLIQGSASTGGSGAAASLSPDTYGLDLTTLCTGGATELIITGPDGIPHHVKCP